ACLDIARGDVYSPVVTGIGYSKRGANTHYGHCKRWAGTMATRTSVTKARMGVRRSRAAIRDIAALAGVSVATVSRVLNGRPDVSPATRETVLRHIRELGYVSNRNARALASGRTGLIGLTVPYVGGHFFTEIVAGA